MENPLVSVIVPCYNYGDYILETIESILASTYNNIEIIIVNDGSSDTKTIELLSEIEQSGKANIIHQLNAGLPAARNSGIKKAKGKYILPLDADDLINPSLIMKSVWILEQNNHIGFVYSLVKLFGDNNEIWYTEEFDSVFLLHHNYIPATAMYKKELWEQIAGYDENMKFGYEDWEFWIRVSSNGWIGRRIEEPLFYYRKHGISMLSESRQKHDEIINYIRNKHKSLYNLKWKINLLRKYLLKKILNKLLLLKNIIKSNRTIFNFTKIIVKKYRLKPKQNGIYYENQTPSNICNLSINKKYKVIIILPWLKVGGVEKVFLDILNNIKERESFHITIITTLMDENPWSARFEEVTDQILHLPLLTRNDNEMVQFVIDYASVNEINCIHISNSQFGYRLTPFLKSNLNNIRIIDTLHMEEPYELWDYFRYSMQYSKHIDERVVITSKLANRLVTVYGEQSEKIKIIENGINLNNYVNIDMKRKTKIVFVGRLVYQKQPLIFVEIAQKLLELKPDLYFLLVGDGPLFDEVKSEIYKLGIEEHISILGYREDVSTILSEQACILIAPSLREGLPIIGIEAMAAKVAIIASDVSGWNDLIDSGINGVLVPQDKIDAYVESTLHLLENTKSRTNILEEASNKAYSRYSSHIMSDAYQKLYRNNKEG